jgi:hypothetical protein
MTTITPDDLHKAADHCHIDRHKAHLLAATLGITIAPPAPSEAMVKLAAYVVQKRIAEGQIAPSERTVANMEAGALAALQHVEKLVLDAPTVTLGEAVYAPLPFILTAIGSNHD